MLLLLLLSLLVIILSLCLCLSLSLSISLSVSASLSLSFSLNSVSLSGSLSVTVSVCLSVSFSLSLSLSPFLSPQFSLSPYPPFRPPSPDAHCLIYSAAMWYRARKNSGTLCREPRATNDSVYKVWCRIEYCSVCFACCQEFWLSKLFCFSHFISLNCSLAA